MSNSASAAQGKNLFKIHKIDNLFKNIYNSAERHYKQLFIWQRKEVELAGSLILYSALSVIDGIFLKVHIVKIW